MNDEAFGPYGILRTIFDPPFDSVTFILRNGTEIGGKFNRPIEQAGDLPFKDYADVELVTWLMDITR